MKTNHHTEHWSSGHGSGFQVKDEEMNRALIGGLRRMEYRDPPPDLLAGVMRGVRNRRIPWWRRLQRWATAPQSLVFTPLQLVPLIAVVVAVCAVVFYHVQWPGRTQPGSQMATAATEQVKLVLSMPSVKSAAVIGSFNDWQTRGYEMNWNEDERAWTLVLRLPKGRYEYAFVVDDQIIPDPGAGIYQEDGFGNRNAVLLVGNGHETEI